MRLAVLNSGADGARNHLVVTAHHSRGFFIGKKFKVGVGVGRRPGSARGQVQGEPLVCRIFLKEVAAELVVYLTELLHDRGECRCAFIAQAGRTRRLAVG